MRPYVHQIETSDKASRILKKHKIVYIASEERTGKTLSAILTVEKAMTSGSALVITKKAAMKGWQDTLKQYEDRNRFIRWYVINYHSVNKLDRKDFNIVILDESHNYISSFPKTPNMHKTIKPLCKDRPIIYISATPSPQGYQQLYHQFKLSSFTPFWKFSNGYEFYAFFAKRNAKGQTKKIKLYNRYVETYKDVDVDKVEPYVKHLFITNTRSELGFTQEPEDIIHWVELSPKTKEFYNALIKHRAFVRDGETILLDTPSRLNTTLAQLEGGTFKHTKLTVDENDNVKEVSEFGEFGNTEKIDYILANWGDSPSLVIMYHFRGEYIKLKKHFKNAEILQASRFAEGVDLSMYDTMVVYSQDYSTAKYTQRRARQANIKRTKKIDVHFLLVKGAVSSKVYKTVAVNKKNYVDRHFYTTKDYL